MLPISFALDKHTASPIGSFKLANMNHSANFTTNHEGGTIMRSLELNEDTHLRFVDYEKRQLSCPQCAYTTDRKNNLKRHVITMHQESSKMLECCGIVFRSKAALREHVTFHHRGGYRCQICGRNFCRKALLRRHLTVHSGQKDYRCRHCSYATSHKSNLERHQKVHIKHEGRNFFSTFQEPLGGHFHNSYDKTWDILSRLRVANYNDLLDTYNFNEQNSTRFSKNFSSNNMINIGYDEKEESDVDEDDDNLYSGESDDESDDTRKEESDFHRVKETHDYYTCTDKDYFRSKNINSKTVDETLSDIACFETTYQSSCDENISSNDKTEKETFEMYINNCINNSFEEQNTVNDESDVYSDNDSIENGFYGNKDNTQKTDACKKLDSRRCCRLSAFPYKCSNCGRSYPTQRDLRKHDCDKALKQTFYFPVTNMIKKGVALAELKSRNTGDATKVQSHLDYTYIL